MVEVGWNNLCWIKVSGLQYRQWTIISIGFHIPKIKSAEAVAAMVGSNSNEEDVLPSIVDLLYLKDSRASQCAGCRGSMYILDENIPFIKNTHALDKRCHYIVNPCESIRLTPTVVLPKDRPFHL